MCHLLPLLAFTHAYVPFYGNSMRLQRESCVYIVNRCCEIVANNLRTSLHLSHSSEIGAEGKKLLIHISLPFFFLGGGGGG